MECICGLYNVMVVFVIFNVTIIQKNAWCLSKKHICPGASMWSEITVAQADKASVYRT